MRQKAEKKIREAVKELGSTSDHRLDKVRGRAGLHPKVYDKTILDMQRVGTIELSTRGIEGLSPQEISALVHKGATVYVSFNFIDTFQENPPKEKQAETNTPQEMCAPPPPSIETIVVILQNLLPGEWECFEDLCKKNEDKKAHEKIEEMIRQYLYHPHKR
jgi:hypothetical protein